MRFLKAIDEPAQKEEGEKKIKKEEAPEGSV
jgi:hypothetical protein